MGWGGNLATHPDDVDYDTVVPSRHRADDRVDGMDVGEVLGVHCTMPGGGVQVFRQATPCGARRVYEYVHWSECG